MQRLWTTLTLATALTVGLPALSALPGGVGDAFTSTAEAGFGGRVKNIRIRERNNASGYRIVTTTQGEDGPQAAEVRILSLEPTDGGPDALDWAGEVFDGVSVCTPESSRTVFKGDMAFDEDGATDVPLSFTVTVRDDAGLSVGLPIDVAVDPSDWPRDTTGALIEGRQITVALKGQGYGGTARIRYEDRKVRFGLVIFSAAIENEGGGYYPAELSTIEVQLNEPLEGPAPVENPMQLQYKNTRATWRTSVKLGFGAGGRGYVALVQPYDPSGNPIGEAQAMDVIVEDLVVSDEADVVLVLDPNAPAPVEGTAVDAIEDAAAATEAALAAAPAAPDAP